MSPQPDFAVCSRRVVTPEDVREGAVLVQGGRIQGVVARHQIPAGCAVLEAGASVVFPGLVDAHVHINDPGRADWEGFEHATRAAAAGGVTTLVDMPLNSIPATTNTEALKKKMQAAKGRLWVDCGFWGGLVSGSAGDLKDILKAGALGVKAFLIDSGVDEFPKASESDLRAAMPLLASCGIPLLVHAELQHGSKRLAPNSARAKTKSSQARQYSSYLASHPKSWENEAIRCLVELSREYGCRVHIVHLSSAEALFLLAQARYECIAVSAETCPHYLYFTAEEIPDGRTEFKCCPPIRDKDNREQLWAGLALGLIDFIASDHSPCPTDRKELKSGDFHRAWGGIASLELLLPATWTQARKRSFTLRHLALWLCSRPAEFAGLGERKGRIAPGYDADFVLWDPEAYWTVSGAKLHHRHKFTPYEGQTLYGVVKRTFLKGEIIYDNGAFGYKARGQVLLRSHNELHPAR